MYVPRERPITSNFINNRETARQAFLTQFQTGVRPSDGRQPIDPVLCDSMVSNLPKYISTDAPIGVYDTWFQLCISLKNAGFTNLTLIETRHDDYVTEIERHAKASGINIITQDTPMKFDVIIGNPPYSDMSSDSTCSSNLDSVFLLDAMNRASFVSFLMRVKHFADERSKFRQQVFSCGRVDAITYVDPRTFNIDDRITVCNIVISAEPTEDTTVTYKNGEQRELALAPDTVIFIDNPDKQKVEHSLASRWVRGKSNRNQLTESEAGFPIVVVGGSGDSPVMMNTSTGVPTAANHWGVVTNTTNTIGTLGRVFLKPYEAAISASVTAFLTESEAEAEQLLAYLLSDEGRVAIRNAKTTPCISQASLRYVADPLLS